MLVMVPVAHTIGGINHKITAQLLQIHVPVQPTTSEPDEVTPENAASKFTPWGGACAGSIKEVGSICATAVGVKAAESKAAPSGCVSLLIISPL